MAVEAHPYPSPNSGRGETSLSVYAPILTINSVMTYPLLCVFVPILWGLLVYQASNGIEALVRRQAARKGLDETRATLPPIDYHI